MILRKELIELSFDISSEEHERRRKDSIHQLTLKPFKRTHGFDKSLYEIFVQENVCLLDAVLCIYVVWNTAESLQE